MRAVVQRVSRANVEVEGAVVGSIDRGLLVFLGVGKEDDEKQADYLAEKVAHLRIFEDDQEKMNLSVQDVRGDILVISQFTLYGDLRRGRRPSFIEAKEPEEADRLYRYFVKMMRGFACRVCEGVFQAHMHVSLVNDGPVTILLDSQKQF